jgi:hypothetical protein
MVLLLLIISLIVLLFIVEFFWCLFCGDSLCDSGNGDGGHLLVISLLGLSIAHCLFNLPIAHHLLRCNHNPMSQQ